MQQYLGSDSAQICGEAYSTEWQVPRKKQTRKHQLGFFSVMFLANAGAGANKQVRQIIEQAQTN